MKGENVDLKKTLCFRGSDTRSLEKTMTKNSFSFWHVFLVKDV